MTDPTSTPNQDPREQSPDPETSTPHGSAPPPPPGPPGGSYTPPPAGMAPPPPMYGQSRTGQPADLLPRFLARLIDMVLLAVVNGVLVGGLVLGAIMGTGDGVGSSIAPTTGSDYMVNVVSSVLTTAVVLGYFALMESGRGQTVGKMLLKLETRGPGGGRPTLEQALRRNAFLAIGLLGVIPFLGFIAGLLSLAAYVLIAVTISNNSATRQGWHDEFAGGTSVVKLS